MYKAETHPKLQPGIVEIVSNDLPILHVRLLSFFPKTVPAPYVLVQRANDCTSSCVIRITVPDGLSLEITRREATKYSAIRGWFFHEKTFFHKFGDSLRNFGSPAPDAGVEHPPVKNAIDCILCLRLPSQIIENFVGRSFHIAAFAPDKC